MKTPSVTPALRDSLASLQSSAALGVTAMGTLILLSLGHVTTPQGCVSAASTTPLGMSVNSVHLGFLGMPLHKTAHVSKTYVSICFDFTSKFCFQLASLPDRLPLLYVDLDLKPLFDCSRYLDIYIYIEREREREREKERERERKREREREREGEKGYNPMVFLDW